MKTRNQTFAELQKEFDKKRLKEFWGPILFLEAILAMLVVCFVIAMIMPDSKIDDVRPIIFVLGGMALLFLLLGFIVPLFHEKRNKKSEFHVEHIMARLVDEHRVLLEKKSVVEVNLKDQSQQAEYGKFLAEYLECHDVQAYAPGRKEWTDYAIKKAEEDIEKRCLIQKEFDEIEVQLHQLEIKYDFYTQVDERTFWQYLKSWKWLKRIRKEK